MWVWVHLHEPAGFERLGAGRGSDVLDLQLAACNWT